MKNNPKGPDRWQRSLCDEKSIQCEQMFRFEIISATEYPEKLLVTFTYEANGSDKETVVHNDCSPKPVASLNRHPDKKILYFRAYSTLLDRDLEMRIEDCTQDSTLYDGPLDFVEITPGYFQFNF